MIINNLKELNKYGTLKLDDKVMFRLPDEVLEYKVCKDNSVLPGYTLFLDNRSPGGGGSDYNGRIFNVLNLDEYNICSSEYGYSISQGNWPWAKDDDFEAITRVVRRLYKEIKGIYEDEAETDRFSLIDLD